MSACVNKFRTTFKHINISVLPGRKKEQKPYFLISWYNFIFMGPGPSSQTIRVFIPMHRLCILQAPVLNRSLDYLCFDKGQHWITIVVQNALCFYIVIDISQSLLNYFAKIIKSEGMLLQICPCPELILCSVVAVIIDHCH